VLNASIRYVMLIHDRATSPRAKYCPVTSRSYYVKPSIHYFYYTSGDDREMTGTILFGVCRRFYASNRLLTGSEHRAKNAVCIHIPTDFVVAPEASDVKSSSRLACLLLTTFRRRFVA